MSKKTTTTEDERKLKHKPVRSQALDRVRAKAHYNFNKRLAQEKADREVKEQLDFGEFSLDDSTEDEQTSEGGQQ
jgi:hypothetical protein